MLTNMMSSPECVQYMDVSHCYMFTTKFGMTGQEMNGESFCHNLNMIVRWGACL